MDSCELEYRPKYFETDQMGVVYHGNYFTWFEAGRDDYFRGLGYSYSQLEQNGVLMVVIQSQCDYVVPARYDDELIITATLKKVKGARISFEYEVSKKDCKILIAKAVMVYAFVDRKFKPINIRKSDDRLWTLLNTKKKDKTTTC